MAEKSIMIDIDDPRAGKVAEVLGNKTCKKILSVLAEEELSESDISSKLKIPLNTVGYNVKKLKDAGLIETSKKFHWSQKGKKVVFYKLSNKRIVISPKSKIKGIVPAVVASFVIAGFLRIISLRAEKDLLESEATGTFAAESMKASSSDSSYVIGNEFYSFLASAPDAWAWFLIGSLMVIVIVLLWNWNRKIGRTNE